MKALFSVLLMTVVLFPIPIWAGEWLDEFEGDTLHEEWDTITDRPEKQTVVWVEDGKLWLNEPLGNFGHTITDGRPLVLRDAPKGEFSLTVLFDTDPPAPAGDYWIGLFVIASATTDAAMAKNWSVLTLGGSKGEKKALIGSMVDNTWNDKGHFDIPGWPVYLRLEKNETELNAYYKENEADAWIQVGQAWNDNIEAPEKVGIGFVNNWGGTNLTLITEFFALEGPNVTPMAVEPTEKLPLTWSTLKRDNAR